MTVANDTIVAVATPPGRGGVAIVRVSGPLASSIATHLIKKPLAPRYATFSVFFDKQNEWIDEGIALYFPAPHSFTGEDVLELQGHGGPVIVDQLVRRVIECGARLAKPGEFSERAFLNNKMDLTQAEAIADLIEAASIDSAKAALRSLQGEFSKQINSLLVLLIRLRTYIEASIDFVEEEIDFLQQTEIVELLSSLKALFYEIEQAATSGVLLRDGITVVIVGEPNVGKSSLLNRLCQKDIAIVTDIPGTTRDLLREYIHLEGIPLHLIDTAGLRESEDPIEQEGIRRAKEIMKEADFILVVQDIEHPKKVDFEFLHSLSNKAKIIIVQNKIDLLNQAPSLQREKTSTVIKLSAKENKGLELLKECIKSEMEFRTSPHGAFSARRRHLDALSRAKEFLRVAEEELLKKNSPELIAENLRLMQSALSEITGEFSSDDLLGSIFSSFCIGK